MKREIKFRGKRIDNGEWAYGYYCYNPLMKRGEIFSFDELRSYVYEVDPATVGQFTGMKDKSGKDIYEGDIVRWSESWLDSPSGEKEVYTRPVQWSGTRQMIFPANLPGTEIIGNLHDNPELLKEESNG